ncbi:MAG TPA: twin-arginine translocation signal domain-containing protein [Coriobacteriia bacterium]|nr:twin-arginine translocation signal domain-containing protein [Coriobacteriia bacterium]
MSEKGITRRQFVGTSAAVAAASALPLAANVTTAAATPVKTFPVAAADITPWVPLNALAAARYSLEIYRGKYAPQGG